MRQARCAAPAVTAVLIATALGAHAGSGPSVEVVEPGALTTQAASLLVDEITVYALTTDYTWGYWCGVKQPLGAYHGGLNIHEIVKSNYPDELLRGNPDYLLWVDENALTFGIAEHPTGEFDGNVQNPGGMATFDTDGTIWYTYGGRALDLPLDLYRSDAPYDVENFTRVLDDFETYTTSTTPCVHVHDGKLSLFWRHGWSSSPATTIRLRRYDVAQGFDVPEFEVDIGQGTWSAPSGQTGIEQLWTRFDPRHERLFVSWQWFDYNPDTPPSRMGSSPFLQSNDFGDSWKRADELALPVAALDYTNVDTVIIPHDHIALQEDTDWMVADLGVAPAGTYWMTSPVGGDASVDDEAQVAFWHFDGGAWVQHLMTGGMTGQTKAHACGSTLQYLVFAYAELAQPNVLKVRLSQDGGVTWGDPIVVDTVDPADTISWVSFVQPTGHYPDDAARFFYGHYPTAWSTIGKRYRNNIRWIRLNVAPIDADLDGDGVVGFPDLTILLAEWGCAGECTADIDRDHKVGFADLTALLGLWTPPPKP